MAESNLHSIPKYIRMRTYVDKYAGNSYRDGMGRLFATPIEVDTVYGYNYRYIPEDNRNEWFYTERSEFFHVFYCDSVSWDDSDLLFYNNLINNLNPDYYDIQNHITYKKNAANCLSRKDLSGDGTFSNPWRNLDYALDQIACFLQASWGSGDNYSPCRMAVFPFVKLVVTGTVNYRFTNHGFDSRIILEGSGASFTFGEYPKREVVYKHKNEDEYRKYVIYPDSSISIGSIQIQNAYLLFQRGFSNYNRYLEGGIYYNCVIRGDRFLMHNGAFIDCVVDTKCNLDKRSNSSTLYGTYFNSNINVEDYNGNFIESNISGRFIDSFVSVSCKNCASVDFFYYGTFDNTDVNVDIVVEGEADIFPGGTAILSKFTHSMKNPCNSYTFSGSYPERYRLPYCPEEED